MDWLLTQAQTASPFIATFCLVVGGGTAWLLWRQLLFERSEHRGAERNFTDAARRLAVATERLAVTIDRPRRRRRRR